MLDLDQPLDEHPDFPVSRDEARVVCEVRQFDLGTVDSKLAGMKSGVLSEKDIYGRARFALIEKARQLQSLADSGVLGDSSATGSCNAQFRELAADRPAATSDPGVG